MKKILLIVFLLTAGVTYSQNGSEVIVFKPARGLNNGSDQGGLSGGKDAWVYEYNPSSVNDTTYLLYTHPVSNCNETHAWSLIRFDLSSLPSVADSVFVGFTHYAHTDYCYSNCAASFYFYPILTDWEENTVTYNNKPSLGSSFYGPIDISFPNNFGTREYNITDMYRLWKSDPDTNRGFAMYSPSVGCNNAAVGFFVYSSDDTSESRRPYLKVYAPKTNSSSRMSLHSLKVFPNPADQELLVQTENLLNADVSLTDLTGRLIYRNTLKMNSLKIDTKTLNAGNYILTVRNEYASLNRRILIQR